MLTRESLDRLSLPTVSSASKISPKVDSATKGTACVFFVAVCLCVKESKQKTNCSSATGRVSEQQLLLCPKACLGQEQASISCRRRRRGSQEGLGEQRACFSGCGALGGCSCSTEHLLCDPFQGCAGVSCFLAPSFPPSLLSVPRGRCECPCVFLRGREVWVSLCVCSFFEAMKPHLPFTPRPESRQTLLPSRPAPLATPAPPHIPLPRGMMWISWTLTP